MSYSRSFLVLSFISFAGASYGLSTYVEETLAIGRRGCVGGERFK